MFRRSFGEIREGIGYRVVDEHRMRRSATVMMLAAFAAFVNGFVLHNFIALPFISGAMVLNFLIGLLFSARFAPSMLIAALWGRDKPYEPIGAIQKAFAWGLGLVISLAVFVLSLFLLQDLRYFEPVCMLCMLCMILLYMEAVLGVCAGCKLYFAAVAAGILKKPQEQPRCMGDSCER